MIENEITRQAVELCLLVLVLLLLPASYRVFRGPESEDRFLAVDLITTLLIGIIVMLALIEGTSVFVDMAIALAAFAFIGTISIARFLSETIN